MSVLTKEKETPPGWERQRPVAYGAVRTLTASAQRVQLSDPNEIDVIRKRRGADTWQDEAWEYYDAIGEIKYAMTLVGNVTSRVRLFAAAPLAEDEPPVSVEDAAATITPELAAAAKQSLLRLGSAHGGMAGLLRDIAINIAVAGECYLMQTPEKPALNEAERWDIRSVSELVTTGGNMMLRTSRYMTQQQYETIAKNAFVGRIWRPHPRFSDEADSSMRALRDLCDELLLIARTVRATARSRLNAGALFVPDGLSVSASEDQDTQVIVDGEPVSTADAEEVDEFEDQLVEAMTTPIADEESASAVVPLLIRGPAELGKEIRPIKFERSFDAALTQRADRILERIMQGIDVPKDVVTGLANVKYSNAVQIDESLYKAHIEPLVLLICDAITAVFLRPALVALGFSPAETRKVVVWYDPSEILTRPDRASDANDGYDRYALSWEAWRRHHGFPETDSPTKEEILMRIVVSRGQLQPDLVAGLLQVFVPEIMDQIRQQNIQNSPAPLSDRAQQILSGAPAGPAPDGMPQPPGPPGVPPPPPHPEAPGPPQPVSTMPSPLPPERVPAT